MTILAMDTSAKAASVCLATENAVLGGFFINTGLTHSRTLAPMTEQLCKNADVPLDSIDAVAVNAGPGSFTGVRIGVAAAKGIAFPRRLPCVAVSTLESMAYNFLGCDGVICALMDARCSQVYNAFFRVTGNRVERLCDDRAVSIEEIGQSLQQFSERVTLAGDGAAVTAKVLGELPANAVLAPPNHIDQTAVSVALAAFEHLRSGDTLTPEALMPVYLRLPQAQRELNKKLGVQQ